MCVRVERFGLTVLTRRLLEVFMVGECHCRDATPSAQDSFVLEWWTSLS